MVSISSGRPDEDSGARYRQSFSVPFQYDVFFTRAAFDPANPALRRAIAGDGGRGRCLFVVDAGLIAHRPVLDEIAAYCDAHADALDLAAPPEALPGGEAVKSDPAPAEALQRRIWQLGMDRHSHLVAVGGGAFLDMAGFAAAIAHRGLRHVRMPTTVLAQADSGIGVKNGVNAFGVKNFTGTFAPPHAVVNDLDFLDSLGTRDRRAGMAEAVKVALIRDAGFFAWIESAAAALRAFQRDAVERLVRRCAVLHMRHIALGGDPFERGSARPLDFGHWAAHKLEMLSGNALRHGEAVAIGLALDSRYSVLARLLPPGEDARIATLLERLGFTLWHPALDRPELLDGLREFREHLGGELTVTLLAGIGRGVEVHEIDPAGVRAAVDWLRRRRVP